MARTRCARARGFTLTECGVTVMVVSLLVGVMGPSLSRARLMARGATSAENLAAIGQGGGMYAQDNAGRLFGYSWRGGEDYIMPDGRVYRPSSDTDAAGRQNQEILMRRTGRLSGVTKILHLTSRIPHKRFSHLVLQDYMGQAPGGDPFIDPSDEKQLHWAADPLAYLRDGNTLPYGNGVPSQEGYDADSRWAERSITQRWAFASSYQPTVSAWNPDALNNRYIPVSSTPHLFLLDALGPVSLAQGRNLSEVMFNSHKVWMFEEFDREQAQGLYFGYDHARPEKLMFDGSVNSRASGEAVPSIIPEYGAQPWTQKYVPLHRFPLPSGGFGDETELSQRYRWTYRGLLGIDYGPFSFGRAASKSPAP